LPVPACAAALCAAVALLAPQAPAADHPAPPEGKVRVKEIRTFGHEKTSRGVILHYCELRVGDVLTQEQLERKMNRTERNLLNTLFFSRVHVFDLPRGEPGQAVIMIDLAEGTDWHLAADTWQVRLSKENIGGDAVTVGAEFGLEIQRLFYEQPWIFDTPLETGASAFFENGHPTDLEDDAGYYGESFYHEAAGAEGWLGYLVNFRARLGLAALGEYVDYYETHIKIDPEGRFGVRPEAFLLAARPYVEWDGRDNDLYPTRGFFLGLRGELSPPAVSNYDYEGFEAEARGYLSPGGEFVLAERIRGGIMTEATPYIRRLSIRGADGLRNVSSSRTIGTRAFVATTEVRRRLFPSPWFEAWFEGVAFFDVGRAWDPGQPVTFGDFDYAFGPGLRLHLRSPLYFDWRAELNFNDGLAFYATARRAF
jgi:outer membrane protein assembly factor BamA